MYSYICCLSAEFNFDNLLLKCFGRVFDFKLELLLTWPLI